MKNVARLLAVTMALVASAFTAPAQASDEYDNQFQLEDRGRGRMVLCESHGYDRNRCYVGGSFQRIELADQISNSACRYGRDWGYDSSSIWVDHGCRAYFKVVKRNAGAGSRDVQCESQNYRYTSCEVGFYIERAQKVRQISNTRCEKGVNWGVSSNRRGIWADDGCRGVFRVYREDDYRGDNGDGWDNNNGGGWDR